MSKHKHQTSVHDLRQLPDADNSPSDDSSPSGARHSRDEISQRAYSIYLEEGCPEGHALEHWLAAEAALQSPRANA